MRRQRLYLLLQQSNILEKVFCSSRKKLCKIFELSIICIMEFLDVCPSNLSYSPRRRIDHSFKRYGIGRIYQDAKIRKQVFYFFALVKHGPADKHIRKVV